MKIEDALCNVMECHAIDTETGEETTFRKLVPVDSDTNHFVEDKFFMSDEQILGGKLCSTCDKKSVCKFSDDVLDKAKELLGRSYCSLPIDIKIICKEWSGKVTNYR